MLLVDNMDLAIAIILIKRMLLTNEIMLSVCVAYFDFCTDRRHKH